MNILRFTQTLTTVAAIAFSPLGARAGTSGDCADSSVMETVYSIVRAPDMLIALLASTSTVRNGGPIGQAILIQWYSQIEGQKNWSQRKTKIETRVSELKNSLETWQDQQPAMDTMKKKVLEAGRRCRIENQERHSDYSMRRQNPYAAPSHVECNSLNKLQSDFYALRDNQQSSLWKRDQQQDELKKLEKELSVEHREPPEGEKLIELKFTEINEEERTSRPDKLVCRGEMSVKLLYPKLQDLGSTSLLYSVQPNLVAPDTYIVRVQLL